MRRRLSLANKCLLLFGGAIVLAVTMALAAPFIRMNALVDDGQLEVSRQMIDTWERLDTRARAESRAALPAPGEPIEHAGVTARRLSPEQARRLAEIDPFLARALRLFASDPRRMDLQSSDWHATTVDYRYAKAHRSTEPGSTELDSVILLERRSIQAGRFLLVNIVFLFGALVVVLTLSMLVFYQITHRLILSPVEDLKQTAERVREGDLNIRAEIHTGDEFEELAQTFNRMLADMQGNQKQLRAINDALDVKLHELAETNEALLEAAKIKGEFLANVSHELRTPLNSIIGFAELLLDVARAEQAQAMPGGEAAANTAKRIRYLDNIVSAGRSLLDFINSLLEMSKLEAGKVRIAVERISVRDALEGAVAMIAPLADRKGLSLRLDVDPELPLISTDPKKFRQIVFNFLSNAVKFTDPSPDRNGAPDIRLSAVRLAGAEGAPGRLRVSVTDSGRGIPRDKLGRIFEKFYQIDSSYSREHTGTGLGLAICKELAALLQGEVSVESEPGKGSTFSVTLPIELESERAAETELESRFRAALAGRRAEV